MIDVKRMSSREKFVLVTLLLFIFISENSHARKKDKGLVVLDHYECTVPDNIVIATSKGYTTAEVQSGYSETYSGMQIYGHLHSYGLEYIFDERGKKIGKIWIEDYVLDFKTAKKWCFKNN